MILLLKCPKCKNNMRYSPKGNFPANNKKTCVYCGHSYKVGDNILKREK